jgi:hypothetical protein
MQSRQRLSLPSTGGRLMGMVLPFQMPSAGGHILIDRALAGALQTKR